MALYREKVDWLELGVCLIFFTTPIESVAIPFWGGSLSLVKLSSIFLLIMWVFHGARLDVNKIIATFSLLSVYALASVTWAINPDAALNRVLTFLVPTILVCSIVSLKLNSKENFKYIMYAYIAGCLILAFNGYITRGEILEAALYGEMERVTALGQNQNEMQLLLNVGASIILILIKAEYRLWRIILYWIIIIFFSFVMLTTGSRTGLIVLIAILVIYALDNKSKLALLIPFFLLSGIFIYEHLSEGIIQRFIETGSSIREGDLTNRVQIWKHGIEAFQQENMFLGVGYLNFPDLINKYYGYSVASHNSFLSAIVCLGFLGCFFFYKIIFDIIKYTYKIYKLERTGMVFLIVTPVLITITTIEAQFRRWVFLLAIVLFKYYQLCRNQQLSQTPNENT